MEVRAGRFSGSPEQECRSTRCIGSAADIAAYLLAEPRSRFLIATHRYPDGDGLGSATALRRILELRGRAATVVAADLIPRRYDVLPRIQEVVRIDREPAPSADALIALDCASAAQLSDLRDRLPAGLPLVNLDHHVTNPGFGDRAWIDPGACATGAMVLALGEELEVPLDAEQALSIYVALVTDTGNFTRGQMAAQAHRIVARLLAFDLNPGQLNRRLFRDKSMSYMRFTAGFLNRIERSPCGRLAWGVVTAEMSRVNGISVQEVDDLIDLPRSLQGVQVSAIFREEDATHVRVSLRSENSVDVARVAERLGGGGHSDSAGCRLEMPIQQAQSEVIAALLAALAGQPEPR